ncbi:MAG: hypothetical protein Q4D74_00640 [Comamonadaceae bacterium]|nr:hypothetical protein [Comamonadaceae bacterium]
MPSPARRAWALGLWLALLAAALAVALQARYSSDMTAFLPRHPDAQERLLVEQIQHGALSRTVLLGIDGGTPAQRADTSRALAAALRSMPGFVGVLNGDADSRARDQQWLLAHRYVLSPAITPARFEAAGLRQAVAASITALSGSAGLALKHLLPSDPTGELAQTLATAGTTGASQAPASHEGVWATADGARALLVALLAADGTDIDAQAAALAAIQSAFRAASPGSALHLALAGGPVQAVYARATIRHEVQRLSMLGGLGVLAWLWLAYRSPRNVLIGLLPIATGVAAAMAVVALGFGTVYAITIGFGTTLMGEAMDYSIYYLTQARRGHAWQRGYWPAVRLGVATSVCGFTVLLLSSFPGLAQLGAYSLAGLLTAALVTRFILPALPAAPVAPGRLARLGAGMAMLYHALPRLRWPLAGLTLAALAMVLLTLSGHSRAPLWAEGLAGLNPAPRHLQMLDAELRQALGAPDPVHLVVATAPTADAALRTAEQAQQQLAGLLASGAITHLQNPAHWLPSAATQAARRAALPDEATLRARLPHALAGLPLRAERLEPFVQDVAQAREQPPLTASHLAGSSFHWMVQTLLLPHDGGWAALLPLTLPADAATRLRSAAAIRQALASAAPRLSAGASLHFLDVPAQTARMFGRYLDEALRLVTAGCLGIALLLAWALRRAATLARVLLPLAAAVAWVMAAHAALGVPMTLLHLVGLLLVVAVGSNYALFLVRHEGGTAPLAPLALANLTTITGFGVLAFSPVPVLHAVGATVAPGALLALLLAMAWRPMPPSHHASTNEKHAYGNTMLG